MLQDLSRRSLLRLTAMSLAAAGTGQAAAASPLLDEGIDSSTPVLLNLNENAFGPSARVRPALERALPQLARYATAELADEFTAQVAAYEHVSPDQVILGEILGGLGLYLGSVGGPGGEFIYSTPAYLALVSAAANVGGVGVPVPLDGNYQNDLPAIRKRVGGRTRAVYLINPHNPTGTLNDTDAFHAFLREVSAQTPVIVDEAYLEYSPDFQARSAVSLVRDGANVLVFRTFDKIHGLAGLPIGYTLGPRSVVAALKQQGLGDADGLGRLNLIAAGAALADQAHLATVREQVTLERRKWNSVLDHLKLRYTASAGNFIFFDSGHPHDEVAARLRKKGVIVARQFPPYNSWLRITIGTPEQNVRAQTALRAVL